MAVGTMPRARLRLPLDELHARHISAAFCNRERLPWVSPNSQTVSDFRILQKVEGRFATAGLSKQIWCNWRG